MLMTWVVNSGYELWYKLRPSYCMVEGYGREFHIFLKTHGNLWYEFINQNSNRKIDAVEFGLKILKC